MSTTTLPSGKTAVQLVEEGKRRLDALTTRLTRAKTILESESTRLENARAEARDKHGVSQLAELETLLANKSAENDSKAIAFSALLDTAEVQVKAIEAHLAT